MTQHPYVNNYKSIISGMICLNHSDHTLPTGVVLCVPMKKTSNEFLDYNLLYTHWDSTHWKLRISRNQPCFVIQSRSHSLKVRSWTGVSSKVRQLVLGGNITQVQKTPVDVIRDELKPQSEMLSPSSVMTSPSQTQASLIVFPQKCRLSLHKPELISQFSAEGNILGETCSTD